MDVAEIKIWDRLAGAVVWDEAKGYAVFEYDPSFRNLNWDLAPLQMSVYSEKIIFEFPVLRKKADSSPDTFKGLPGLLADSLPDQYGNELINIWLAQQGRPPDSMNPVEMLCFMGKRGMGALEFEPATFKERKRATLIEIESLVEIAQRMLSKRKSFYISLKEDEEKAVMDILRIGTSAGGARPKAV